MIKSLWKMTPSIDTHAKNKIFCDLEFLTEIWAVWQIKAGAKLQVILAGNMII